MADDDDDEEGGNSSVVLSSCKRRAVCSSSCSSRPIMSKSASSSSPTFPAAYSSVVSRALSKFHCPSDQGRAAAGAVALHVVRPGSCVEGACMPSPPMPEDEEEEAVEAPPKYCDAGAVLYGADVFVEVYGCGT